MDYEKKYKESMAKMFTFLAKHDGFTISKDGEMYKELSDIFPELKESEDEKIRKEIMNFIDTKTIDSDERRNRWFSYLEKYKPISFTSLEDIKVKVSLMQYISELNQDVVHLHPGIETCNEWIAWLEKQGEQKSAEFKPSFRVGDVIKPKDPVLGEPRIIKGIHPKFGYGTNNGILDFEYEDNWEAVEEPVSEELEEASKNYALNNTPWDDCKDEIQESFKAGAKWQKTKDESTTEDLGEYINELSKQFPEVSFAKLSRIAVRAAKWQKEQFEKDCADLCNGIATAKGIAVAMAYDKGVADTKEQMMANAIDAQVLENYDGKVIKYDETILDEKISDCKVFDKVKVIIIKED